MVMEDICTQFNAAYSGNVPHPGCHTIAWVSASAQSQSFQHFLASSLLTFYKKSCGKKDEMYSVHIPTEVRKT